MQKIIINTYKSNKEKLEKLIINLLKEKKTNCIFINNNVQVIYNFKNKICKEKTYKITIQTNLKL